MSTFGDEAVLAIAAAREALAAIEDNVDSVFQFGPGAEKTENGGFWVECRVWVNKHQVQEMRCKKQKIGDEDSRE